MDGVLSFVRVIATVFITATGRLLPVDDGQWCILCVHMSHGTFLVPSALCHPQVTNIGLLILTQISGSVTTVLIFPRLRLGGIAKTEVIWQGRNMA